MLDANRAVDIGQGLGKACGEEVNYVCLHVLTKYAGRPESY